MPCVQGGVAQVLPANSSDEKEDQMIAKALEEWLLMKGFAEELPGYGHATAHEIAEAMVSNGWFGSVHRSDS